MRGALFQAARQLEQGIVAVRQFLQHLQADLTDDLGARVVILVDTMTEAHQAERVVLVLGLVDILFDLAGIADLFEHVEYRLVGTAVCRSPKRSHAGRDAGEGIGARTAHQADRRGRGVLLVVRMQDEQQIHGALGQGVHVVILARRAEHHVQEVTHIAEPVARIHRALSDIMLIRSRCDGRHLGEQAECRQLAMLMVLHVDGIVVKTGQGPDHADHHGHGVGVVMESLEEAQQGLVDHGVVHDRIGELVELVAARQFAVHQQIGDLQETRLRRQLLYRVAPVT